MDIRPLTKENLLMLDELENALDDDEEEEEGDPIDRTKSKIIGMLRCLRSMGPEGIRTVEESSVYTSGSTLSYRGSNAPDMDSLMFWRRHFHSLNDRFQTLSMVIFYQRERALQARREAQMQYRNVRPWVIATTCKVQLPPDAVWHPPRTDADDFGHAAPRGPTFPASGPGSGSSAGNRPVRPAARWIWPRGGFPGRRNANQPVRPARGPREASPSEDEQQAEARRRSLFLLRKRDHDGSRHW